MDMKARYWQIPGCEDKKKTAFRKSSGKLLEYKVMPFGLCNASFTFSRLMDLTLSGMAWEICLAYLNNVTVFAKGQEEHLQWLELVLASSCWAEIQPREVQFGAA